MSDNIEKAPNVPPFVRFVCSAVPMVFDDSLSYYEALCALWKWLQDDVVNVINNNATVTEDYIDLTNEYIEKFNELKDYVDTYFENLDVQEEINNKLDAMAEDGTLAALIANYTFYATPINFGAVGDGVTDDTQALQDCIDYANTNGLSVYLPHKTYLITDSLIIYNGTKIEGNGSTITTESNVPMITASGVVSKVEIHDLNLVGSNEVSDTLNNGIELVCYYSTIDKVNFRHLYKAIKLSATGASGTLVENKIRNCEVHECQSGFDLGESNNNKITDGILENCIVTTTNASLNGIFIGSVAGWNINNIHVYGSSTYGLELQNGFYTNVSNIYVESTSDIGIRFTSVQTDVNASNINVVIKKDNGIGIKQTASGYLPHSAAYLNMSNVTINAESAADTATGIDASRLSIVNYRYHSLGTTFTPLNSYTSGSNVLNEVYINNGRLSDESKKLKYKTNELGISNATKLDISANTASTISFTIPDELVQYDMRTYHFRLVGYQYWDGTKNFDYEADFVLISKNFVYKTKIITSSDTTNFASAPALSYADGVLTISFTPSVNINGCYRIDG